MLLLASRTTERMGFPNSKVICSFAFVGSEADAKVYFTTKNGENKK
jgi:hypothetical protein